MLSSLLRCQKGIFFKGKFNRSISNWPREVNPRVEKKLKLQDGISDEYSIVYRAPLKLYVRATYSITIFSLATVPPSLATLLVTSGFSVQFPVKIGHITILESLFEFSLVTILLALVTAQVSMTVFRYPFRVYKGPQDYIVVYQHLLPWKTKNVSFKRGDLVKSTKGFMPWKDSLYEFGRHKAILLGDHFVRPLELDLMMKK